MQSSMLMFFGIFLCLDAFLYVFTLLPLRVFLALFRLFTLPCYGLRDRRLLQPAQVCDILKGVILIICYFMMHYVDYSMMYHLIRGQSVIKLYIIYNMLEVADRLFSSFGQDILDALYWTATEPKERKRAHIGVIPHFFMAVLYVYHLWVLFPDVCMVIASEIAVDIVKHAFITKFNDITADVYSEYRASLAFDLVSSRQKNVSISLKVLSEINTPVVKCTTIKLHT
ncbi:transmembrane anterior posterior transformation 1 [Cricetulus griseus]